MIELKIKLPMCLAEKKLTVESILNSVFRDTYQNNYLDLVNFADIFLEWGVTPDLFYNEAGKISLDKILYSEHAEFCLAATEFILQFEASYCSLQDFITKIFPQFWEIYIKLPKQE